MNDAPVCGSWAPIVYSNLGFIPVETNITKIEVECTVTGIHPNKDLNVLGADNLTITGTNFPKFIKDNTVDIHFTNT